jgi:hypothetical protein
MITKKKTFVPPMEVLAARSLEERGFILVQVICRVRSPYISQSKSNKDTKILPARFIRKKAVNLKLTNMGDLYRLLDDIKETAQKYRKEK